MKSLHLTNAYHPSSGGVRTWYHQALDAAEAIGWDMCLVVPSDRDRVEALGAHTRIHHVRAPRAPVFDRRYRMLLPHRYLLPGGAIRRILLDEQPAIVEIADKYALNWLAGIIRKGSIRGLRRPLLVGFSFERMDDNVAAYVGGGSLARRLSFAYMRWCYDALLDCHLAASEYTADELRQLARWEDPLRVRVQPMGVRSAQFDPACRSEELRASLLGAAGGSADTLLLLYAGRLSPEKNLGLLVETMGELAGGPGDYRLVVAGSGPLEPWLRETARTFDPGRIVLHGQVQDRLQLAALYATCDIFVHPNPREPFGIGPLEAMASGCPLVAPDRGGVVTYATAGNAWLAAPVAAAFAAAIRSISADPDERRRRVSAARETAERFDTTRVVQKVFTTYAELHAHYSLGTSRVAGIGHVT